MDHKEYSSFVSPDSLRQTLQMLKSFYNNHTQKEFGRKDINAIEYVGHIHNFGSELLLESRKLLMDKPPLKRELMNHVFDFYFELKYSELIQTYDQQCLLKAVLKPDVLLSNKTYYIRFENCDERIVLRAESHSDPTVYRDIFVHTKSDPILIMSDDNQTEELALHLFDDCDYFFHVNHTTNHLISQYNKDEKVLTLEINNNDFDLPIIWACINDFRLLPDIGFDNNRDLNHQTLLTIGTDGHDITRLYPLVYGDTNIPSIDKPGKWVLKAYTSYENVFTNSTNTSNNYNIAIKQIVFENVDEIGSQPYEQQIISFNQDSVEIKLSTDVDWSFRVPRQGDYDYDGTTYNNQCYAYINLDAFEQNKQFDGKNVLLSAFVVTFNESYVHKYESVCVNALSGIHIDASSDYSDNGISKNNGVVHNLGEFDGLPSYFSYMFDRMIHRAHVELYTIRDDINNQNQTAVEKQTAALILDSAFPQTELLKVDGLNTVIKYSGNRTFVSEGESVSPRNALSEITYINGNTFGHVDLPDNENLEKFVYHGGRTFSLGMMGFDPLLEMGRVYYVNNDEIVYENNDMSNHKKADRCLARICDIPTAFPQLMHVSGHAPTFVIDEDYVRTNVPFTNYDLEMLWNIRNSKFVELIHINPYRTIVNRIFDHFVNLDNVLDKEMLKQDYSNQQKMNTYVDLRKPKSYFKFEIHEPGSGYQSIGDEKDKFTFIIGGVYFEGIVERVDEGRVASISISENEDAIINISNIDGRVSIIGTTTTSGSGSGLKIRLEITKSYWDNYMVQESTNIFDDLYAFKFDEFDNIWIWKYDIIEDKWNPYYQFTGIPTEINPYDDRDTQQDRGLVDVMINNLINQNKTINHLILTNQTTKVVVTEQTNIPSSVDISNQTDLSTMIDGMNVQDTFYSLIPSESSNEYHNVEITTMLPVGQSLTDDVNHYVLPKHHKLNLFDYYNRNTSIAFTHDQNRSSQPISIIYDPLKSDIESHEIVCSDIYYIKSTSEQTFVNTVGNVDIKTGALETNVYWYDETTVANPIISTIQSMSREELLDYVKTNIGDNTKPIQCEEEGVGFTKEMLLTFIVENTFNDPVYKKDNIKLLRQKDEIVVDKHGSIVSGVGKQPTGGYKELTSTVFNPSVYVDNMIRTSNILFLFKVDVDPSEFGSIDNYRIKDDCGNDITEKSMLIYNNKMYAYINGWKHVLMNEEG